jgi:hypothetical protein
MGARQAARMFGQTGRDASLAKACESYISRPALAML